MLADLDAGPEVLSFFLAGKTTVTINARIIRNDFQYMSSDYFTHLHSDSDVDYRVTVYKVQHIKHFRN